ncbi:MAG TPA: FAD-linked oxidase C-terminal domain-containing protein [Candidatus Sulfotelmatobacter sp.]|nr:FAD-linked oxidase C-terminal domain-containing protein [Candidatus Sulfotelmatobacter sp.]
MSANRIPLVSSEELKHSWRNQRRDVDAAALELELRNSVQGEVRFDAGSKALYAADASNYRQVPIGVVIPKSRQDVIATVAACRRHGAPLLSRGGGTSLAGQCCNVAVVLDWTKYMNHILELNPQEKYARVEPGTINDNLRNAAKPYTLTWGPDPATHNHCTFGGMLGNNSCGAHAQMAGKAVDNLVAMDIVLYDGTEMTVGWMEDKRLEEEISRGGRVGEIYARLKELRTRYAKLIDERYPHIPRRVSGYNLDQLLPGEDGRFNIARALVGSECTLATILEAKVQLIYSYPKRVLLVLGYPNIYEAGDHVPEILKYKPIALEGIDEFLVHNVKTKNMPQLDDLSELPEGKGWLVVEFGSGSTEESEQIARDAMKALQGAGAPSMRLYVDEDQQQKIWDLREAGLGATAFVPGQPLTWPGWEDSAIAPDKVGAYLRDLCKLYEKYQYKAALYGHFGQGCIHCRVDFDLMSEPGIRKWRSFMEEATDLVTSYDGSLSGEHGDGQARAEFLYKMFGPELIEAFREFKSIWDPDWKMNPGKIVDPYRIEENLRLGAEYDPWNPKTHFKFPSDDGSFARAALRCVGVGKCRRENGKGHQDTMCPSFMVTHEEMHSTRGRTHLLWEMMNGEVIQDGWRDEHIKEALDLCLACKGCKGDCPVNVDVATYKAEFLSHYWEGRMRPIYAYAFGWIDKWARLASIAPGFANLFTQVPGLRALAKKAVGVPQQRRIPAFAAETFQSWFRKRPNNTYGPRVLLWADTFNNYFMPETARAAVEVLEDAGCRVEVLQQHLCCGRPLYDYGFLDMAKTYLHRNLNALQPYIASGTPMVVLEPSCCSVFRDEMNNLMPESDQARRLTENTFTLSEFLEKKINGYKPPEIKRQAIVQGHCHHKAIMRLKEERSLMKKAGLDFQVLESGCCGMAGSFGYEQDKYQVSIDCGERALLPEVRKTGVSTIVIADGFSCKEQIAQETNRHALHLAEVLQMGLHKGEQPHMYPERHSVEPRKEAQKRSMMRAGVISAGVLAVAVAALVLARRR